MKPISKVLCSILFASFVMIGAQPTVAQTTDADTVGGHEPDIVLHIRGLACDNCSRTMTQALLDIDGIAEAQVFLEGEQHVNVMLEKGAKVDKAILKKAVEGCGFVLEGIEDGRPDTSE